VRDAVAALARSFKSSVHRHARDQHAGYLESALSSLRGSSSAAARSTHMRRK